MTPGSSLASLIISLNWLSIASNLLVSSGSCALISSEAQKIGWSLYQFLWVLVQIWITESTVLRFFYQCMTFSLNSSTSLEDIIPMSSMECCSTNSTISSIAPRIGFSFHSLNTKTWVSQMVEILLSLVSILASLVAPSTSSVTSSEYLWSSSSMRLSRQNFGELNWMVF